MLCAPATSSERMPTSVFLSAVYYNLQSSCVFLSTSPRVFCLDQFSVLMNFWLNKTNWTRTANYDQTLLLICHIYTCGFTDSLDSVTYDFLLQNLSFALQVDSCFRWCSLMSCICCILRSARRTYLFCACSTSATTVQRAHQMIQRGLVTQRSK